MNTTRRRRLITAAAGGGAAAALAAQLVAAYTFENSGNLGRDSSSSGNHLTNNGGVTQVAGNSLPGTHAANFVSASSQSLSIASNASLVLAGTSWEMTAWVNFASYPGAGFPVIAGKWGGSGGLEYLLFYSNADSKLHAAVSSDGVGSTQLTTIRPSVGTWMFLDVWFNAATTFLFANANNAAFTDGGSANTGGGTNAGTNNFRIGADDFAVSNIDAAIDSVNLWKRLLTPAERTDLYSAGVGLEYPYH